MQSSHLEVKTSHLANYKHVLGHAHQKYRYCFPEFVHCWIQLL